MVLISRSCGFLFIAACLFSFNTASASTTGSVGSPGVKKGKTEAVYRAGYSEADESSSQDERFRVRAHIDHGFTDFYAGRIIVSGDRRKGDNLELDSVTFENRFDLLKAEDIGFDFGMRASYAHKDGDKKPSSVSVGFYELVPLGKYEFRANQIFDHEVGEDAGDGIGAQLRLQVTGAFLENHKMGLESFHDFGNLNELSGYDDQSHTFGPVFKGKLIEGLKYETGYRAGISGGAPDHSIKFFLNHAF